MGAINDRLRQARIEAGFKSAAEAAKRFGWTPSTYSSHENGQTPDIKPDKAREYARAFKVSFAWLLTGEGDRKRPVVDIVGFVGAGSEAHFTSAGELGDVVAPEGSTPNTVAVVVRGQSLGSFFDRWLVFYDDVRRPITSDMIGQPCVIGLADGRVLIKSPQRSKAKGLYHLFSNTEPPILDVEIEWAALVKSMMPR